MLDEYSHNLVLVINPGFSHCNRCHDPKKKRRKNCLACGHIVIAAVSLWDLVKHEDMGDLLLKISVYYKSALMRTL